MDRVTIFFYIVLSISLFDKSFSQICENEQVAAYGEKVKNATRDVIRIVQSAALKVPIESLNENAINSSTAYSAVAAGHGVNESKEGFTNFAEALDVMINAHVAACYGLEEDKPAVDDAPELLNTFLSLLSEKSNFTTLRQLFGKLICLKNFNSENDLKRKRNIQCASSHDIIEFYNCLNPNDTACIFYLNSICKSEDATDLKKSINCLGFMVDTSGSMGPEISAVRDIVNHFVAAQENYLTLCYLLVTFSDSGKYAQNIQSYYSLVIHLVNWSKKCC